jgi:uncharacterized zinc-type alcohol dehydrogenase-like protein
VTNITNVELGSGLGLQTKAYAAFAPSEPLREHEITRRQTGPHDVLIDIKFCGICHSDLHMVSNEWGNSIYPVVPGHEIAGVVAEVGSQVKKYKVGDRVGVGCMVDSCRECPACREGLEQYCEVGNVGTYGSLEKDGKTPTYGGYSKRIVVDENFVLRIPDNLSLETAAPLLCAGITTYSPLMHWHAGPGKMVGVVGLGGLGHMAVQIAHALGAQVTVFGRSADKTADAKRLGADDYYSTAKTETFEQLANKYDLIINTVSAGIDIDAMLSLLKRDGTLVNVGAPPEPLPVAVFSLIMKRRSFAGSLIGGIAETQEMLDFCGKHNFASEVEVIPASKINEAYERIRKSDVRYRFVIDIATL